jgi:membrane protease YdiL (CAAX protease family)
MDKDKLIIQLKCLLIVVLMFFPNLFHSMEYLIHENQESTLFSLYNFDLGIYSALSWLIISIQVSFPIILIMIIGNESFNTYGFNAFTVQDLIKSLARLLSLMVGILIVAGIIIAYIISYIYTDFDPNIMQQSILNEKNSLLMIVINIIPIVLVAFAEELCFRSFLYINLNKLINKKWVCIIISNVLFAIYHIYQGITAVIMVFLMGIIFSMEFKKHNNIYTITIFHAIWNISTLIFRTIY